MNYYVNFLEGIGKVAWEPWGDKGAESATLCQDSQATLGIGGNGFHIKWIFNTQDNWKNENPGGRFGATSKVIHPKYYKHLKKASQHSHLGR